MSSGRLFFTPCAHAHVHLCCLHSESIASLHTHTAAGEPSTTTLATTTPAVPSADGNASSATAPKTKKASAKELKAQKEQEKALKAQQWVELKAVIDTITLPEEDDEDAPPTGNWNCNKVWIMRRTVARASGSPASVCISHVWCMPHGDNSNCNRILLTVSPIACCVAPKLRCVLRGTSDELSPQLLNPLADYSPWRSIHACTVARLL